jgi:hypothetical protein
MRVDESVTALIGKSALCLVVQLKQQSRNGAYLRVRIIYIMLNRIYIKITRTNVVCWELLVFEQIQS